MLCRCFEQVTCKAVTIRNLSTANELVDTAIAAAMQEKKPVLIQVCSPLTCMSACKMPYASAAVKAVLRREVSCILPCLRHNYT